MLPDNAFDEKITLRHTADFGANPEDLVFEWWYREDDDTVQPPPDILPDAWAVFPDPSGNNGLGAVEIAMAGAGKDLSIDLTQPASTSGVTAALQLAASRIAGFYALLGNEAYTDSLDPTIGFDTESGEYGSLAPTIFSFINQMPALLQEELALLRGLDEEGARPGYNRLLWNFTNGEGEVAYALSYNISDVTLDGFIDEADGRTLYPQAHGDAWGHYLTALQTYYDLLKHPEFNWESRAESFSIEGVVIEVDYLDERKFAEIAAAKAKTGAEIVNLTYRSKYTEDPTASGRAIATRIPTVPGAWRNGRKERSRALSSTG